MKLGGIFRTITRVFGREQGLAPVKLAPAEPISAPPETTTLAGTHKEDRDISAFGWQLADSSLVRQVRTRGIDLNKISINALGLTPGVISSLRSANIRTVEQLSTCPRDTLFRLRSIGIGRLVQIEKQLNSLLKSILTETNEKPATQLSFTPVEEPRQADQADLRPQLYELIKRLCDIFAEGVPLASDLLPPQVWKDLIEVLGEAPTSFSELMRLVYELKLNDDNDIDADSTGRCLALKRATQWLKRAVEYGSLDEEIHHFVDSLNERERLILSGRYKIDRPLTLEALGGQLGITRERVRQIQQKVQKKLIARIKRATLLYSTVALYILKTQKDNVTLKTWTKQLIAAGFLKDPRSLELLIAVAKSTKSSELSLPEGFTQSLETNVSQHILANMKPVLEKARKMCRNCGAVRVLSLTNEKISEEDVEQILRLNRFEEMYPGWWTRDIGESVPERVGVKVIMYCGPVSPSTMRYALRRHLSRFQLPSPPSELLVKILEQKDNFTFTNGLIQLSKSPAIKPSLTGPEEVFLNMVISDGPIVSFEAVHHKLLEAGLSTGSVTSVLKYSPIVHKVSVALYSLLGAKYDEIDVKEAQAQLTRISADSTLKVRSDGVIEFETNAGTWLEYGGVLSSGPAKSLKGDWRLIISNTESGQLVVDGYFIRGLSQISKSLGVIPGDRIRIEFNTWTREAKMLKVVRNG